MGLDTMAFKQTDAAWKTAWVERVNKDGARPVLGGLAAVPITQPVTLADAPEFHQDGLAELAWPGMLGIVQGNDGSGPAFRGKDYDYFVDAVTGRSLYDSVDEPWHGDVVREVAAMLRAAVDTPPARVRSLWGALRTRGAGPLVRGVRRTRSSGAFQPIAVTPVARVTRARARPHRSCLSLSARTRPNTKKETRHDDRSHGGRHRIRGHP